MRTITRILLASVLAIGAAAFAGCGDTDCPAAVTNHTSCSSAGLTCDYENVGDCTCENGTWECSAPDIGPILEHDMATRDLARQSD